MNPPRAGLADDVLGWLWGTQLDVVGAIHDPWVTFERIREHIPRRLGRSLDAFHGYVSADPSTHVAGTPLPGTVYREAIASRPLREILEAVACATRCSIIDIGQRGPARSAFVWLADEQGWARTAQIGEIAGVSRQAVARILRGPEPPAVAPARMCLALPNVPERNVRAVTGERAGSNVPFGNVRALGPALGRSA